VQEFEEDPFSGSKVTLGLFGLNLGLFGLNLGLFLLLDRFGLLLNEARYDIDALPYTGSQIYQVSFAWM
jgi:hypothetical protein